MMMTQKIMINNAEDITEDATNDDDDNTDEDTEENTDDDEREYDSDDRVGMMKMMMIQLTEYLK